MTPDKVQSYVYAIGEVSTNTGILEAIGRSPEDLVVLGYAPTMPTLDRTTADPNNNKLIIGYIDVTEATSNLEPDFIPMNSPIPAASLPSWFGKPNTQYFGVYSVQYWAPEWEPVVFALIDQIIAKGYDGVFLDVLSGDSEWQTGNTLGNPVYSNATKALATLVDDIKAHIASKNIGRAFYIMGNNPQNLALQYPATLKDLDIIFNEALYYSQTPGSGFSTSYVGTSFANYLSSTLAPAYVASGAQVFGNDYPLPLTDPNTYLQSLSYYSELGWPASVNAGTTSGTVLSTGPYLFMARPGRPSVAGLSNAVNYISGGSVPNAILIGGNRGDFFIGGPGANTITGGAGNDTIYAHPANANVKNLLDIQVVADVKGLANPSLTVLVNGKVANGPTTITATFENGQTQDIQIDTTAYGTVTSIELDATGPAYVDANHVVSVQPQKITFQGQTLSFASAQFDTNTGSQALNNGGAALLNPGGKLVFGSPTLPLPAPASGNAADVIEGGGGVNTVIYRAATSNYTIANQADGSVLVTSASTAEGPDTLRNIQFVQFTDKTVAINSSTPLRNGAIFSTSQAMSESFLRLFNAGTKAGTVTAALSDYATGNLLGQWTSDSIPPGAELQYPIGMVEAGAGINGTKPSYYSLTLDSGITGNFQHVLYRPLDGTLTNLSTCATGVTANAAALDGVHSSLLGTGYPSSVVVVNTGTAAETVALDIYDARNGNKLGTYTTAAIPAGGETIIDVSTMEAAIKLIPGDGMYHYVVKAETPFAGYLQNLVNNTKVGVITDMTTSCSLNGAVSSTAISPLQEGAVFSTAQSVSQSFLRFFNTGTNAGSVSVTLKDAATGQALGTWKSPSIPALSEQQFAISSVEAGANIGTTKPSYYTVSINSGFPGYFQHVLFRPSDGTLTNLSTCPSGVTADATKLSGVHSSIVGGGAFPSSVVINNTGSAAEAVTLDIYDARDGSQLGTYTTTSIPPGGQVIPLMSDIETAANIKPTSGMYHYVLKARSSFTGFLQNLVDNTQVGVITDMTTACTMVPG
jgi:cysteinyl-tRNA synthetase